MLNIASCERGKSNTAMISSDTASRYTQGTKEKVKLNAIYKNISLWQLVHLFIRLPE